MSKELTEKIIAVQSQLKAPKGQFNKFGNYAYRSCEDILEAVKPLLAEQGITLVISDEMVAVGERVYVKATATVSDGETVVSNTACAREAVDKKGMDDAQITGSASSYARKYALNGLFLIDDTKDADATNDHGKKEPAKSSARSKKKEEPKEEKPAPARRAKKEETPEEPKEEKKSGNSFRRGRSRG